MRFVLKIVRFVRQFKRLRDLFVRMWDLFVRLWDLFALTTTRAIILIVVLFVCYPLFLIVWVSPVQPCQSSLIMIMKAPTFSFC